MKNAWQIWTLFSLTLAIVLAATTWLTFKTIELDGQREIDRQQTELARREAELQERINSALYRMDWILTPLIAQEAARPYYLYQPFFSPPATIQLETGSSRMKPSGKTEEQEQPSPLLIQPSEFVKLHFQINSDNQITSPQRPEGKECELAMACCGVTKETFGDNDQRMAEVKLFSDYQLIKDKCPSLDFNKAQTELLSTVQTVYFDPTFNRRFARENAPLTQLAGEPQHQLQSQQMQRNRAQARGNQEYAARVKSADEFARNQWAFANSNFNNGLVGSQPIVREGVMRPMWLGEQLVLARRVAGEKSELVQCCWLDWEKIRTQLAAEVADILPQVDFERVQNTNEMQFGRALAALPVQVIVDSEKLLSSLALQSGTPGLERRGGIRWSLLLAWAGLVFAACATALLLQGVMRLSERRAAFVSAVTHELRTPLTTFRMYAEMLAEEMVPADKHKQYAETLKSQADRLSHLVENVLQFARLERHSQNNAHPVKLSHLFESSFDRLQQRTKEAEMILEVRVPDEASGSINVDIAKIEQVVFNLVDNACKYAHHADDKRIVLSAAVAPRGVTVSIQDFGDGVPAHVKRRLFQPFCKSDQEAANTAAGVGLGLALCKRMAQSFGGKLRLVDSPKGTRFELFIPGAITAGA